MSEPGWTALAQSLEPGELYSYLQALQSTKYLAVACFALLGYDYLLTFEQEVQLFWRRGLTITRILFFLNRYLPPLNSIVVLFWFLRRLPSQELSALPIFSSFFIPDAVDSCRNAMWSTSVFTVFELIIMQAILVARVVHLWTWRQGVQRFVFGFFLVCVVIVISIFGVVMSDIKALVLPFPLRGCFEVSEGSKGHLFWAMLVPTFVLETVLVILTVTRVAGPLQKSNYSNKLLRVLFRDGCVFYACVFVCVGFAVVGARLWEHPQVAFPAIFSGFLPAVLSICASRLLFNLHELAEELIGHPTFALNDVELRRLNLRKGPRRGEFIVDPRRDGFEPRVNGVNGASFIVLDLKREDGRAVMEQAQAEHEWLPYIKRLSRFRIRSRATWGWTS